MSTTENKAFILRYLEAVNKHPKPLEMLQEFVADQSLIDHILFTEQAFPLYWLEVDEMIAEGDLVSLRMRMHGIHRGDFMGVPPTGKEINVPGFLTYRIAGGKIVEHWMMADYAVMLQQLGASLPQEIEKA